MPINAPAFVATEAATTAPSGMDSVSTGNQTIGYHLLKSLCDNARREAARAFSRDTKQLDPHFTYITVEVVVNNKIVRKESLLPQWCTNLWPGIEDARSLPAVSAAIKTLSVTSGANRLQANQVPNHYCCPHDHIILAVRCSLSASSSTWTSTAAWPACPLRTIVS